MIHQPLPHWGDACAAGFLLLGALGGLSTADSRTVLGIALLAVCAYLVGRGNGAAH